MAPYSSRTVTAQEIISALEDDDDVAARPDFAEVSQMLSRLPAIAGPHRLAQPATFACLLSIQMDFVQSVLDTDFDRDYADMGITRHFYEDALVSLQLMVDNLGHFLEGMGWDEEDLMMSEEVGLSEKVKALYRMGELTIADLMRYHAEIFLPPR